MTNAPDLRFDAGVSATASDTVLLCVTLTGVAFHDEVDAYRGNTNASNSAFSLIQGSGKGDTTAFPRYTGDAFSDNTDAGEHTDRITIDVRPGNKLGVTEAQAGGVKVELVNATLEGVLGAGNARTSVSRPRAVEGVPGVVRTVTPAAPIARVRHGFQAFDDGGAHRAAWLGTVNLAHRGLHQPVTKAHANLFRQRQPRKAAA